MIQLADTYPVGNYLILMASHTLSTDIHVVVLTHTLAIDKLFICSTNYHFFLTNSINQFKIIVAHTFLVYQSWVQRTETRVLYRDESRFTDTSVIFPFFVGFTSDTSCAVDPVETGQTLTLFTIPLCISWARLTYIIDSVETTQTSALLSEVAPTFILPTFYTGIFVEEQSWFADASFDLRNVDWLNRAGQTFITNFPQPLFADTDIIWSNHTLVTFFDTFIVYSFKSISTFAWFSDLIEDLVNSTSNTAIFEPGIASNADTGPCFWLECWIRGTGDTFGSQHVVAVIALALICGPMGI